MSHIDSYRKRSESVFSPAPYLFIPSCLSPTVQDANTFTFFTLTRANVPLAKYRWRGRLKGVFSKYAKAFCGVSTSRIQGFDFVVIPADLVQLWYKISPV